MTTHRRTPRPPRSTSPLRHPRLPRWAPLARGWRRARPPGWSACTLGWGVAAIVIVGAAALRSPCRCGRARREPPRRDRPVRHPLVWVAFAIALVPLISLLYDRDREGLPVLDAQFLTYSMRNVIGEGGGIYHAIIGTLLITLRRLGHLGPDRPAHRDLPRRVRRRAGWRARSPSSST